VTRTREGGKGISCQFNKPDEEGPVEVIREGKVRMLIPGKPKPIDYPLSNLAQDHRDEVERIAKAAANGAPRSAPKEEGTAKE